MVAEAITKKGALGSSWKMDFIQVLLSLAEFWRAHKSFVIEEKALRGREG